MQWQFLILILLLLFILILLIYLFIIKPWSMSQLLNRYHFRVDWGGNNVGFTEVSGLDIEVEAVNYSNGASPEDNARKVPGLRKFSNVTLKRGIAKNDNDFFNWINTKRIGDIERRNVIIALLDEDHNPIVVWRLKNAFPVHYYGPVLSATDGNIAIETLVLTHEGITVETT